LAKYLIQFNKYEAVKEFQAGIEMMPEDLEAHFELSQLHEDLGLFTDAENTLKTAAAAAKAIGLKEETKALDLLWCFYERIADYDSALRTAQLYLPLMKKFLKPNGENINSNQIIKYIEKRMEWLKKKKLEK